LTNPVIYETLIEISEGRQWCDISLDRRFTVGWPSGYYAK